jgi:putative ABC transport system permease protein
VVAGRLAGRNIRHQLPGFAASFIALVLATLVVTVCGGLLETGLRSDVPAQRLAAAPVLVTGVQGYDGAALTERDRLGRGPVSVIAALPGVARTVDDVSVPVTVLHGGSPAGLPAIAAHDWSAARLTPFRLISGRAPTAAGDVVIDRRTAARLHLAAGRPLRVLARGSVVALRVSGIAAAASAQAPALFVTDARAQALLGRPGWPSACSRWPGPRPWPWSPRSRSTGPSPRARQRRPPCCGRSASRCWPPCSPGPGCGWPAPRPPSWPPAPGTSP